MTARSTPRGLTLVELIIGMVIGGIIGAASLAVVWRGVQSAVYLPNQVRVSQVGSEVSEAVAEGSYRTIAPGQGVWIPGLRYAQQLQEARPDLIRYNVYIAPFGVFEVGLWSVLDVMARWVAGVGGFEAVPYYVDLSAAPATQIQPRTWPDTGETATFRYYDGAGNRLPASPTLSDVRRIEIGVRVLSGSGAFEVAEGQIELVSAVAPRLLQ